ncbi:MAG: tetratricopeptide repeat protein [Chloroflexi bacterium]|nr:MAG: tetratricopeptide repeat protein [Chloroflexota bacterium]
MVDLATDHNQLGLIYTNAGDLERALEHFNQAAKFFEAAGDLYHAGFTRFNLAIMFAASGRTSDALLYARAALRNFEPYGPGAAEDVERTKGLIGEIEQLIEKSKK